MTDHDVVLATSPTNNDDGRLDQSIAEELGSAPGLVDIGVVKFQAAVA